MRLKSKNLPKLSLLNLLKRRKSNLALFLKESGIVTYETLKTRCDSLGVETPSPEEFKEVTGHNGVPNVSSPTEGVVVLQPIPDPEPVAEKPQDVTSALPTKKKRKESEQSIEPAATNQVEQEDK